MAAAHLLAALLVCSVTLPEVADAGGFRMRSVRRSAPRSLASMAPKRPLRTGRELGSGLFTRVTLAEGGTWVHKQIHEVIGGKGKRLSQGRRELLAERSAHAINLLRAAQLPIPRTHVDPKNRSALIQERAQGEPLSSLRGAARERAEAEVAALLARAESVARRQSGGRWTVDHSRGNFLFRADGSVSAWFDPVMPVSASELDALQRQSTGD